MAESQTPTQQTLQLTLPFGRVFVGACVILFLVLTPLEILARSRWIAERLPVPSVGSINPNFEYNLYYLDQLVRQGVPIDCIIIGNSMPATSIDPEVLGASFQDKTGQSLMCYNFALNGATINTLFPFTGFLIQRYDPSLIIYGITPRDFSDEVGWQTYYSVIDIDWTQLHLGNFSLRGTLIDRSMLYRYYLLYSMAVFDGKLTPRELDKGLTEYGYQPSNQVNDVTIPVNIETIAKNTWGYEDFAISYPEEERFKNYLNNISGVELVIAEIPMSPNGRKLFDDFGEGYVVFERVVETQTANAGILYLPYKDDTLIPEDGWRDYFHMNTIGANIYSQWLGARLGDAYLQGELTLNDRP